MPCVHEFCIMPEEPRPEEEFEYTPERYPDQAAVDDDLLNEFAGRRGDALWAIPTYFESLRRPERGLAWYGITLIPPASLPAFLDLFTGEPELADLAEQNKFIIHYGI